MRVFTNVALAYVSWFAVAWLAARGETMLAVLPSLVAILVHVIMSPEEERGGEVRLALGAGVLGLAVEALHSGLGFVRYGDQLLFGAVPPPFMIGLWMAFSTMINVSLKWLEERPVLAALFGAIGGPASYFAGAKLGAISIGEPVSLGLLGIGLVWTVAFPLLYVIARRSRS